MVPVKSLCFQGPQILTWSTILSLFLQWLDCTIERRDQRSKHVAFDRTHKNTTRRCWQELIPRYMAPFLEVELDLPDQYPVITNVWLSLFLASLMWPQQLPWLLEIWSPGWEEAFIHSLTQVNHSSNCLPEELLLQRIFHLIPARNFKFLGNFRSEKYNIYIKNKSKVSTFGFFCVDSLQ